MDSDEYCDYLLSTASFRDRVVRLCVLVLAITVAERFGLLEGLEAGMPGRADGAAIVTAGIVAMWIVLAVVGTIGLYRWLRS